MVLMLLATDGCAREGRARATHLTTILAEPAYDNPKLTTLVT